MIHGNQCIRISLGVLKMLNKNNKTFLIFYLSNLFLYKQKIQIKITNRIKKRRLFNSKKWEVNLQIPLMIQNNKIKRI